MISSLKEKQSLHIAVLVLMAALVYGNSIFNGFVFDDMGTIVENNYIRHPARYLPSFFNEGYFKISGEASYRPIATLSYYLIYSIFKLNPLGYHLFSLIIHILNVLLVYGLMNAIQKNKITSLTAALLFACHPVLTEAVNCISFNEDLLATLFFLLAFVLYLKPGAEKTAVKTFRQALSLLSFLCGLLAKEMAATLPAVILLYDLTLRETTARRVSLKFVIAVIKDRIYIYGGYVLVGLFYLWLRFWALYSPAASVKNSYGSLFEHIIYLPDLIFNYLKIVFLPLHLSADYVFSYPQHFFEARNLVAYVIVIGSVGVSFLIYRRSKEIAFGIWWFLITLSPVYNLIQIFNPLADRYFYLPTVGFCMAAGVFLNDIIDRQTAHKAEKLKLLKPAVIILLVIFYSAVTVARNRDWKDSFRLWTNTVESTPNSPIAHGNLGRVYQERGLLKKAVDEYKKAIQLNSRDSKGFFNLGSVYEKQGLQPEAVEYYQKSIKLNPEFKDPYFNLANIYTRQGLLDDAKREYQKVIEIDPDDFEARNNLGVVYARQGKVEEAVSEWEKVLEIEPDNSNARNNIEKAKKLMNKKE
jgi:tetratricopeptide (TPR) repeat protein